MQGGHSPSQCSISQPLLVKVSDFQASGHSRSSSGGTCTTYHSCTLRACCCTAAKWHLWRRLLRQRGRQDAVSYTRVFIFSCTHTCKSCWCQLSRQIQVIFKHKRQIKQTKWLTMPQRQPIRHTQDQHYSGGMILMENDTLILPVSICIVWCLHIN